VSNPENNVTVSPVDCPAERKIKVEVMNNHVLTQKSA